MMMLHAYAPSSKPPPEMYVRWTWVKEMGIPWAKAGIPDSEIPHLAGLINLKVSADNLKSRKGQKGGKVGIGGPGVAGGAPTI